MLFEGGSLSALRAFVAKAAEAAGIDAGRAAELVVAVNEVATNSIRYGGGWGTLRVWKETGSLICEVRDRGQIQNLLAGRILPGEPQTGGYGLWLVNHICDLVQVRSSGGECVVRLHMNVR
jgi:anti-sigma regulatory factor (Ser/Thr protein kinase)